MTLQRFDFALHRPWFARGARGGAVFATASVVVLLSFAGVTPAYTEEAILVEATETAAEPTSDPAPTEPAPTEPPPTVPPTTPPPTDPTTPPADPDPTTPPTTASPTTPPAEVPGRLTFGDDEPGSDRRRPDRR